MNVYSVLTHNWLYTLLRMLNIPVNITLTLYHSNKKVAVAK